MTVKDMIEKLQSYPEDLEVFISWSEGDELYTEYTVEHVKDIFEYVVIDFDFGG